MTCESSDIGNVNERGESGEGCFCTCLIHNCLAHVLLVNRCVPIKTVALSTKARNSDDFSILKDTCKNFGFGG